VSNIVLDASAVLAVAHKEPGADVVLKARSQAIVSAVNHAEVVSKLVQKHIAFEEVQIFVAEVFPHVIPFDLEQANAAGRLHAATRKNEFSYADCACIALATIRGIPLLTGDKKWLKIETAVEIRLFR
jgi:PIN domain nuclease of toxin-antitoxin system